ncbi:hypothetical protein G7B40_026005 [Aetokthonos hydrillicola Thurmond2011]|jgi:hypothetical protein|uniref:Uncharacterized protein n=1 Tax=Aetokthonos hydrillicola Thurmond2011 TaxID=2712845 RepID=A0AAP5IB84_9CYAN|nr:hypothetical protein [Aetokthonos hydrillicola]MBO3460273.1 hypothetical protein [Aetokthonos hydrillicola CCALA 1050]MBW4587629.1 hypothetical protein [Aetokthonos hydrillicola CCALA 1050]MDR9897989.1 hypothetical protein [Aetokthonos hydrillicola Thurmond2011]
MTNIKHFPFHLSVSLTFAAFMLCQVFLPAQAKTPSNQPQKLPFNIKTKLSDISGTIITGSHFTFPSQIRWQINRIGRSVQILLQNKHLTLPHGKSLTLETQEDLLHILTSDDVKGSRRILTALSDGQNGITETQAQQLVNSLHGLLGKGNNSEIQVNPSQLVRAMKAYNNLINHSSAQFLKNPPPALDGINSVLSQLSQPLYLSASAK